MIPDNGHSSFRSLLCLDPVMSHLNKAEWSLKNCLYSIDLRVVEFWQPLSRKPAKFRCQMIRDTDRNKSKVNKLKLAFKDCPVLNDKNLP